MPVTDIEISTQAAVLLAGLRETCGLSTDEEVVEQALLVLGFAAHQETKGVRFGSVDERNATFTLAETPALLGARTYAERLGQ